jgi:hypothetical protein
MGFGFTRNGRIMELILNRKYLKDNYTIGSLELNGKKLCDALEDPVRDLNDFNNDGDFDDPGEGKIYGQTAVPAGRYRVIFNYSPKYKRVMPLLLNVPGYKGIRIHAGNTAADTAGCILLGENKAKGMVLNSRYHVAVVTALMQKAINEGEEVWITINT